jgi:phosphoribosylformimino-5-aminoimidazole carboxamide ribotide isomerase
MTFELLPAIDVRAGRVVRLRQGDYDRQTTYDDAPLATAQRFARAGARWLHLVDLDAARLGGYSLHALVADIVRTTGMAVQTGGGVRDEAGLKAVLAAGARRVVLGTVAVRDPARVLDWLQRHGADRLVLALDVREDADGAWRVPVEGWTRDGDDTLEALLQRYADAGLRHVLCTDIRRDGMLAGFNVALYARLAARWPQLAFQASGGVRDVGDVRAARASGAGAAILGRALLEGHLDLAEALAC